LGYRRYFPISATRIKVRWNYPSFVLVEATSDYPRGEGLCQLWVRPNEKNYCSGRSMRTCGGTEAEPQTPIGRRIVLQEFNGIARESAGFPLLIFLSRQVIFSGNTPRKNSYFVLTLDEISIVL
jgi:hypothetical protein